MIASTVVPADAAASASGRDPPQQVSIPMRLSVAAD